MNRAPVGPVYKDQMAAWGVQDLLVISTVPSGAADSLRGTSLLSATLTTEGVYRCLVPMSGLVSELEVHVNATFAGGTVTLGGPDTLYLVTNATVSTGWTVKTAGTGDGALTTTVLRSSSVTGMLGEQYAVVTITLASMSGNSVTFTVAEYNGV